MGQGKFNPNSATHEGFDSTPGAPYSRWLIQDGIKFDAATKLPLPEQLQDPPKPKPEPRKEVGIPESSVPFPGLGGQPEPEGVTDPGGPGPGPVPPESEAAGGGPVPEEELPEGMRLRREEREEEIEAGKQGFGASLLKGLGLGPSTGTAGEPPAVNATAAAIKLALTHKVDLAVVPGTGRDGKILAEDVNRLLEGRSVPTEG